MASNSAVLKTLIYSDIFDYPLTKEGIWKFLIGRVDRALFEKDLISFTPSRWERKNGYYFLSGREEVVEKRIKRKKESGKKLDFARKIIKKLSRIPTVLFIGISGGLALENAEEKDDVDLFVITLKNNLWITRLILVFLLIGMGQYRGRGKKESQKVCLNMLIDEEALMFEKDRQDLYTAHEIVQLRPMFDRDNTYNKFLSANKWIDRFLPNWRATVGNKTRNYAESFFSFFLRPVLRLSALEHFAKIMQLLYMKKHRTKETVESHFLAFHPFDYKNFVLKEYNKRLNKYDLPSPRLRRVIPPKLGRSQK